MTTRPRPSAVGAGLCLAAMAAAFAAALSAAASTAAGGPSLRLTASDRSTGERIVLTITWKAWPEKADPERRCRQAALYLGGELARRMTVESVGCAD
ncbi:MAG: hypothetical protein L6R19_16650 [Alphaproteobacteria bacterium]|nr:hypothetical protein [Alphaproteobacteria bacterium]